VDHPFFDALRFPWHRDDAQKLHQVLVALTPDLGAPGWINQRYRQCGEDLPGLTLPNPPDQIWTEALNNLTPRNGLDKLCKVIRSEFPDHRVVQATVRAVEDAQAEKRSVRVRSDVAEPTDGDRTTAFLRGSDQISEPEALLYYDDLTIAFGRLPALIRTLERLFAIGPAVCRLEVDVHGLGWLGTAFRIGQDLLLTNWHVLHRDDGTRPTTVTAEFGYEDDGRGGALPPQAITCRVDSIVADREDDWAVIQTVEPLKQTWPVVELSTAALPVIGSPAYIIQHPGGQRKRVGYVRNQVSWFDDRIVHYLTDTQGGSSGSPVFDADARLIALHHAAGKPQKIAGKMPLEKNEGIRIPRVVEGLKRRSAAGP
jgi:V8-like Glu-specific endopeptidase